MFNSSLGHVCSFVWFSLTVYFLLLGIFFYYIHLFSGFLWVFLFSFSFLFRFSFTGCFIFPISLINSRHYKLHFTNQRHRQHQPSIAFLFFLHFFFIIFFYFRHPPMDGWMDTVMDGWNGWTERLVLVGNTYGMALMRGKWEGGEPGGGESMSRTKCWISISSFLVCSI